MKDMNKNSKKNEKKKLVIISIILLLIIISCIIYFIFFNKNNTKSNDNIKISESLLVDRQYNDILFSNIHFTDSENDSKILEFTLKNTGDSPIEEQWVELIFVDEFSMGITTSLLKIYELQPGETMDAYVTSSSDLTKAIKFSILPSDAPPETSPEDLK